MKTYKEITMVELLKTYVKIENENVEVIPEQNNNGVISVKEKHFFCIKQMPEDLFLKRFRKK